MKENSPFSFLLLLLLCIFLGLICLMSGQVAAALTVTPSTWNVIGLDSNTPAFGPNRFPVGAKVCRTTAVTNVDATLIWGSFNPNGDLRPGSLNPRTISSIGAGACADAFFEVELNPIAAAFDISPQYHITAGAVSTTKAGDVVTATASVFLFGSTQITTNRNGDTAAWRTDAYESFPTKSHRSLRLT